MNLITTSPPDVNYSFLTFIYNSLIVMQENAFKDIIKKWLTGWSLSRELPLPVKYKSGYKVNVGYPEQKARYVFTEPNKDFTDLAETITEPWIYLKVCAPPYSFKESLPPGWIIQPQGYIMVNNQLMSEKPIELENKYIIQSEGYNATTVIKIIADNGDLAAIGRIIIVDDLAIYDRISTDINHRRKGLATVVMKELEKIALSMGVRNNFLVATGEGKLLYESLGWKLYCLYTSVVIPGE